MTQNGKNNKLIDEERNIYFRYEINFLHFSFPLVFCWKLKFTGCAFDTTKTILGRGFLIKFSPIVAWKFPINLVGSFSFIVFPIYKMIENQPSTLTAANIWIESWLGKKHSNIWKKIERQTNVLVIGIVHCNLVEKCILFLENVVFAWIQPFALCLTSYLHNCVVFWKFNQ